MELTETVRYEIGQKILHPMHGAGVIEDIVTQRIDTKTIECYIFKGPASDLSIQIPVKSAEKIGVRPIISSDKAKDIMSTLCEFHSDCDMNWNRRYRNNMLLIKEGNIDDTTKVVKSLSVRDAERGLSTGERKMLFSAKQILISEIALALDLSYDQAQSKVENEIALTIPASNKPQRVAATAV